MCIGGLRQSLFHDRHIDNVPISNVTFLFPAVYYRLPIEYFRTPQCFTCDGCNERKRSWRTCRRWILATINLWFWRLVCRLLPKVRRGPWSPSSLLKIEAADFSESLLTIYMVWNSRRLWFWCTLWCIFRSFILVVSLPPHKFVCTPLFGCCWLTEPKKCEAEMASSEVWYWILEYPFVYDVGTLGPIGYITVWFCSRESSLLVFPVVYHFTTPLSHRILS
jgi:hypothetical protein